MSIPNDIAWVPRPEVLPPASVAQLVVEASAGTGKTFFLEHRVVDLMLGAGAELDQILLVTFTEKATAELRTRIRALIDTLVHATPGPEPTEPCWRIDGATRARLRTALWSFERAAIYTIHGFCQRVLGEETLAARRLFDQSQVAEDVAFDDAWRSLLREQFARDPADAELLEAYLASGKTVFNLRELLATAVKLGVPLLPLPRATMPLDEVKVLSDALEKISDVRKFVLSANGHGGRVDKAVTDLEMLKRRVSAAASMRVAVFALDAIHKPKGVFETLPTALTPNKDCNRPQAVTDFVAAVENLADKLQSLTVAISHQFVRPLQKRLERDKATRGQFDYQDLLTRVDELLKGKHGADVAARIRKRLPWAMIDEFQDTDGVQWNIFRTIWDHPDARGLVIVGDPKQSIYSFRGADVETYRSAAASLVAKGALSLNLEVNYRSSVALVEATNALLAGPAGGTAYFSGGNSYLHPVSAGSDIRMDSTEPALVVWRLETGGEKASIDDLRAALLEKMATEIKSLIAPDGIKLCRGVGKSATNRSLTPHDFFVLTRTNRESEIVATALRRRGIPCALLMAENLFKTEEAADLADVLQAIAAPRDLAARLRALRTAFFAVPWDDLPKLIDAPDHHPLVALLLTWAGLARRRQFHRLFHSIMSDSNYAVRAIAVGRGERALVNTRHVLELLQVELDETPSDITELSRRLATWISDAAAGARTDDSDLQRVETDAAAVTVMTTHRAKGLEAPIIFLFGGTSNQSPPSPIISVHENGQRVGYTNQDVDAKKTRDTADLEENQRLGYVALTRGKLRTYAPWYPGLKPLAYKPIQVAIERMADADDWPASAAVISVPVGSSDTVEEISEEVVASLVLPAPTTDLVAGSQLTSSQVGGVMLSYSRLAHSDTGYLDARREYDEESHPPVEVAVNELPPGAATGLCLHELLELLDVNSVAGFESDVAGWAALPNVAMQITKSMERQQLAAHTRGHAERVVHATLTTPPVVDGTTDEESALPPLWQAPLLARELEFTYPLPDPARGYMRGFLDAVVAWDDKIWIVDYKSDVLTTPTHAAARSLIDERYRTQAMIYGLAGQRFESDGHTFGGLLYWFMRDQVVVRIEATTAQLADWNKQLESLHYPEDESS